MEKEKNISEVLEKEIEKNNELINVNDEKMRLAKINRFEELLTSSIGFAVLAYFGMVGVCEYLVINDSLGALSNIMSISEYFLTTATAMATSLGLGALVTKAIVGKQKLKERFKTFSKAKTDAEKLEEQVKYEIELEKANNRNKAIKKMLEAQEKNRRFLEIMTSKYEIKDKETPQSREECEKNIQAILEALENNFEKLNKLTYKKVLEETTLAVRDKMSARLDVGRNSLITGAITMLLFDVPIIFTHGLITDASMLAVYMCVSLPFVIGAGVAGAFTTKWNQDRKKMFKNLNENLGDDKLSEELNFDDYKLDTLEKDIDYVMATIEKLGVRLQTQLGFLDSFLTEDEQTDNYDSHKSKIFEDEIEREISDEELEAFVAKENGLDGIGAAKEEKNVYLIKKRI